MSSASPRASLGSVAVGASKLPEGALRYREGSLVQQYILCLRVGDDLDLIMYRPTGQYRTLKISNKIAKD